MTRSAQHAKATEDKRILRQAGASVKAQIISSGFALGRLAAWAGVAASTLSNCLAGRTRNHETQVRIWEAYCRLVGPEKSPSLVEFWGDLLSRRIAG